MLSVRGIKYPDSKHICPRDHNSAVCELRPMENMSKTSTLIMHATVFIAICQKMWKQCLLQKLFGLVGFTAH